MKGKPGTSIYIGQNLKGFKILEYYPGKDGKNPKFKGKCLKCGRETIRSKSCFLQENSRIRCICERHYSLHDMSRTRIYSIWQDMKSRCTNSNEQYYYLYGGKGVTVCDEWLGRDGFVNFKDWAISHGYSDDLTIDRIDSNGNYEPSNCRWATPREQNFNRCNTHYATINGITKPSMIWCEELGMKYNTYSSRIKRGWTEEEAILIPIGISRKQYKNGDL